MTKPQPTHPPAGFTRREFVASMTAAAAGGWWASSTQPTAAQANAERDNGNRKQIAIIATEVRKYAHAQHFVDRFLEGYGWQGKHHFPPMDLVSLYVDQFPDGDLARDRERRHPVKIYPTITEACTLGGEKLAVDGVLIIGEHGRYPRNDKGQRLYPRYQFFKEIVEVFEQSGRSVPVFNDKHLSTDWDEAAEMVEDARRLEFPMLAGSSLPVTWRIPSFEMPLDTPLEESVCVCYGGVDSYDFHGLETAQCMSERRAGGEVGVKSLHAVRGDKLWELLETRPETTELVLAALSRSHTMKAPPGFSYPLPTIDWARKCCSNPVGYFMEHHDGFRTSMLMLNGLLLDFNYAGRRKDTGQILSCQMYLPMPPRQTTLASFFSPQISNIEQMILTGEAPYPVERTLLTTGMTLFGVESLYRGEVPLLTPEMQVEYSAPQASTYWRA